MRNILISCVLLVLASCNKDSTSVTPGPVDGIMPLKLGNSWTYLGSGLDSTGHMVPMGNTMIKVVRDTVISGEHWYDSGEGLMTNRSDGLYIWERPTAPQYLMAKYPASENETFTTVDGDQATVVGTSTTTVVPLGSYVCYEYLIKDHATGKTRRALFVCPGKGVVRQDIYTVPPTGSPFVSSRIELQQVVLN